MKMDFLKKINKACDMCLSEIENRKKGISGEASIQQLEEIIIPELKQLQKNVIDNNLPIKEKRYLESFSYAFTVWGWNMNEPTDLFMILAEINNDYKNI